MMALNSDLNKCNSWEQLMDQNRNNSEVILASFNANFGGEVGDLNGHRCACNHVCQPQNQYLIQNEYHKKYLLIGCDCIEKNKILVLMSGTIHSEKILREVFGIKRFKIIEAETQMPGKITKQRTEKIKRQEK